MSSRFGTFLRSLSFISFFRAKVTVRRGMSYRREMSLGAIRSEVVKDYKGAGRKFARACHVLASLK